MRSSRKETIQLCLYCNTNDYKVNILNTDALARASKFSRVKKPLSGFSFHVFPEILIRFAVDLEECDSLHTELFRIGDLDANRFRVLE